MITSIFKAVGKGFWSLTMGMAALASFWIFVLMMVMSGDILGRVFFNHPITGTYEMVKLTIVGIVFLQLPYTLWHHKHVRGTLISSKLAPLSREILNLPIYLLGASIFVLIFIASWDSTIESWRILETSGEGGFKFPAYPIRSIILLSSVNMVIIFIAQFFQSILTLFKIRKKG